ncbi:hypothetical protein K9N68_17750 [Kovacikia minuta CCNUW1]|uniref:hypothetical protein n=1 Tax=Kovacikia minuta TaxID=2931930 RepID=UPI001CCBE5D4|nr:hypothetical protein [Kovacikia minuta]UBF23623.1 hypothetical protein K9N68_17750 [Kovacikia minuta CCNUW1]
MVVETSMVEAVLLWKLLLGSNAQEIKCCDHQESNQCDRGLEEEGEFSMPFHKSLRF